MLHLELGAATPGESYDTALLGHQARPVAGESGNIEKPPVFAGQASR